MAKVTKYSMSCGCVGICTCGAQGIIINPGQGGARGAQGTQGISGAFAGQGVQGTQGSLGVQGTTGSGAQGAQGRLGAQGTVGAGTKFCLSRCLLARSASTTHVMDRFSSA